MNDGSAIVIGIVSDLPMPEIPIAARGSCGPREDAASAAVDTRQLTAGVKRGDEAAFTRFHELYALRLYKLLLNLANGREHEAREVLQVVMIKLTKRFEIFHEESRLWAWLCSVARNSYVDHYRAQQRDRRFVPLELLGGAAENTSQAYDCLSLALRVALDDVPPEDRELLRAFYLDRQPLIELAREAGQSYKAMESRLTRLRRKVKDKMLNHLQNENTPQSGR